QWQGGGVPYLAQDLGEDGGYIDHRILRDGDRYYVLVVTASQPRPYMGQNVLSVYRIDGDHLTRLELPSPFNTQGEKHFLGADGHEMLWDLSYAGKADWRRIRVVDGALQAELIDEATAKSLLKK
ncbi:MAG: hypothetical protein ACM3XM_05390, partial [Mycobacterium leprae]